MQVSKREYEKFLKWLKDKKDDDSNGASTPAIHLKRKHKFNGNRFQSIYSNIKQYPVHHLRHNHNPNRPFGFDPRQHGLEIH